MLQRQNGGRPANEDDTLSRLRDLQVDDADSFDRDVSSHDLSDTERNHYKSKGGKRGAGASTKNSKIHKAADLLFGDNKAQKNNFLERTLSEVNNEQEKNALFHHSMRDGLFNDLRNSPLRQKMPEDLQMYNPALERRLFAKEASKIPGAPTRMGDHHYDVKEASLNKDLLMATSANHRFQEFVPRADTDDEANGGLNYGDDFQFNPTRLFCKQHPSSEVEFCCEINNSFYCRKCQPDHRDHLGDRILAQIPFQLQKHLIDLKLIYSQKKESLVKKLDKHQHDVESIFKMFYDTLDTQRKNMLKQEYSMREKIDVFESRTKALVSKMKTYSLVEFFHEERTLNQRVDHLKASLDDFNVYLPQTQVIMKDKLRAEKDIMVDMRERMKGYITALDHSFALNNYDYVMTEISDKTIRDIYKVLGPFDHYQHHDCDDDMDTQRTLRTDFDHRRSGAQYRGQVSNDTTKPDGMGFKVYPSDAIFEGYFEEGQINGFGRGISSRGEVYQGPFLYDTMHGEGLFQWPDGRLFFGTFNQGKKQGYGTYLWPNGQVYEGEFKNDECGGPGVIHYPDGKKFEGSWKEGKKHGSGTYSWANGARYFVHYSEGKKQGTGTMEQTGVTIESVKQKYGNLSKKANNAKQMFE